MPNGSKKTEGVEKVPPARCHSCSHGEEFGRKILMTLFGVLLVYVTFYVGTLMRNNIKKYETIGEADKMERTITVTGFGKVTGRNDIAMTTIGYSNIGTDVAKAQEENKGVMDKITDEVKKLGIEEKDLQSNYTINPEYDYTQKGSVFKGYRVTNNLTVKIRDLGKISAVLSLAGKYGANQVGGLSFTIDEPENLKNLARDKALAEAKQKADRMAVLLGVRVGEVLSYNDYEQSSANFYTRNMDGFGNMAVEQAAAGPDVMSGSKDIGMNVSVTFKIYPRR